MVCRTVCPFRRNQFSSCIHLSENSMLRQTDHKLTSYADRVLYDYLTNNKFKRFDREVSLEKVPAEAMDAMQRRIPNLKPLLAFERGGRKLHYYTVIGYADENFMNCAWNPAEPFSHVWFRRRITSRWSAKDSRTWWRKKAAAISSSGC